MFQNRKRGRMHSSLLVTLALIAAGASSGASELPSDCRSDASPDIERHHQLARQRLIMGEMRTIATAIECFGVDRQTYPGPTNGLVPVADIKAELVPRYRSFVPLDDAWGSHYLYWSDKKHYVLVSVAADRTPDRDYAELLRKGIENSLQGMCTGATRDPDKDLVFIDGQFCAWVDNQ